MISILSFLHFFAFLVYLFMAVFVLLKDPRASLNRVCACLIICFALWSFGYIFLNDFSYTENVVRFAMNIGSVGWVLFASFFLWLTLIFTEKNKILKSKVFYPIIFILPVFLIYKQWSSASLIATYIRQPYGWSYLYSESILHNIFFVWHCLLSLIALYLCIDYNMKTKDPTRKMLAKLIYFSVIPVLILGTINSVILQELKIHSIPILTDIYIFAWLFSIVYAINKYKFLTITSSIAAETVIASMADSLVMIDPVGNIIATNQAALNLTGYRRDEIVGKFAGMIFGEEDAFKKTILTDLLAAGSISGYETLWRTKTGIPVPVLISSSVIKDKLGVIGGIVIIVHDISNRKKSEKALEEAYDKLREMQDHFVQVEKLNAVGQLASGVAHEVRNPLAIVIQGVDYLESKIPHTKTDLYEALNMIKNSVRRASAIINSLLDFSKATTLNLQPEYITFMLENSLGLVKINLERGNVEVVKDIKLNLPKVILDKNKIEQVFVNILLNAIQAMPKGGKIIIRGYVKQLDDIKIGIGRRGSDIFRLGEKAIKVEFEDTGTGISEENLKKIFDPFFTTKAQNGGTGLGLSVTKNIIDMHKGLIDVESKPGKGTKVIVTLKIAEEKSI